LAASTDISKVVRMEYGPDSLYMDMAAKSIQGWHGWNGEAGDALYHETGFLLLCKQPMEQGPQAFERESYRLLLEKGFCPERLSADEIARRYPALAEGVFVDGFYHQKAGYAESGRVVEWLAQQALQSGVAIHENQTAACLLESDGRVSGVETREGQRFSAGQVVVCAGAWTQVLVPELQAFMRATGHPVFHVKPHRPALFSSPQLPVFAADISNSGWYGFPLHPRAGVLKVGNHGKGQALHPEADERIVTAADQLVFRRFLKETFPGMADDPIVFTRRCLYSDTLDGHFWIDRHPALEGLTVAAGGSGHAFKMAPVLGNLIATAAEGGDHPWLPRFRWRHLDANSRHEEAARNY
jgi:glycine/D-amino acid oxidase-like deaminating enzyme